MQSHECVRPVSIEALQAVAHERSPRRNAKSKTAPLNGTRMRHPRAEERAAAITAESDEVEIAASVEALQTVAHGKVRDKCQVKDRTLETAQGCGTHAYICYLQRVVRE